MSTTHTFDTLIVGAGLIGSSTAMHLALLGHTNVAVVDVDLAGKLSSSELNAGGARATWNNDLNVMLAKPSLEYMQANPDASGWHGCGYLWLYSKQVWPVANQRAEELNQKFQLNIECLSPAQLHERVPFIDKIDDIGGATFSPFDGLFNPNLLKLHFREQAKQKGVRYFDGHEVLQVKVESDSEILVHCQEINPANDEAVKDFLEKESQLINPTASFRVKNIVNCAGAWAPPLAKKIGYETKSQAFRRQISIFDCHDVDMRAYGMIVDTSGVYFHPEADHILAGWADGSEPPGYNFTYDGQTFFEEKIWLPLYERSSKFESLKHVTGWSGLYAITPDQSAIIGKAPGFSNVYECHGFSGKGAMQSYAAGRGVAELISSGQYQTVDLSAFSAERFDRGQRIEENLHI